MQPFPRVDFWSFNAILVMKNISTLNFTFPIHSVQWWSRYFYIVLQSLIPSDNSLITDYLICKKFSAIYFHLEILCFPISLHSSLSTLSTLSCYCRRWLKLFFLSFGNSSLLHLTAWNEKRKRENCKTKISDYETLTKSDVLFSRFPAFFLLARIQPGTSAKRWKRRRSWENGTFDR